MTLPGTVVRKNVNLWSTKFESGNLNAGSANELNTNI